MRNILLVDDTQETYQMVLHSVGGIAELSWAKNINEATSMIKEKEFNLLILDVELPDGSGIDFCYKIQTSHADVPVLFLTSHTDLDEKSLAFSVGADSFLTKPFSMPELRQRILAVDDANDNLTLIGLCLKNKNKSA